MGYDTAREAWSNLDAEKFALKVAHYFVENNWTWGEGVPTASEIAACLSSLAWECYRALGREDKEHSCCGTGRLQVRLVRYESGWTGVLELVPERMSA
jgi:hypothetical protein